MDDVLDGAVRLSRDLTAGLAVSRTRVVDHINALAAEVRELRSELESALERERAVQPSFDAYRETHKDDMEATLRLQSEVRELRKDRERAKTEIEKAVELIQRWGCECEPMIGFTCGPCRVVEMIDAAPSARGEDAGA